MRGTSLLLALCLGGCFGSHSSHGMRDAGADGSPDPTPVCWPPAAAPGVVPCDIPLEGLDDPCQCEAGSRCVPYGVEGSLLRGYCYGNPRPRAERGPCDAGRTWTYDRATLSLPPDSGIVGAFVTSGCVPAADCVRVRDYDTSGPSPQCIYGDFTIAETGVVPAPGCGERPGGLMMCSAGCACDPGYDCGPYSEQHPWAPCYPTGTLVPSMPFDGAWMTRVLTPDQARRNLGNAETERHYVDRDYCPAVAAQFPGLYACDALPAPAP